MKEKAEKLKEERRQLERRVRKQSAGYIIAALGLVAGLAWNEAIKSLIDYLVPVSGNGVLAKFLYAIAITILIVFTSIYIERTLAIGEEAKE